MTIEETLGYSFKNAAYLNRALTRKAYANEQKQQNKDCEDQEIYRTLGDAVLKLVLVDQLIAAIYLDGGFEAARETIGKWFKI